MPKRSYEEFQSEIVAYQTRPTVPMLEDLIGGTIAIDGEDIDERVVTFARGRIELAFRTGQVDHHLRHLYEVLAVLEREMAEA